MEIKLETKFNLGEKVWVKISHGWFPVRCESCKGKKVKGYLCEVCEGKGTVDSERVEGLEATVTDLDGNFRCSNLEGTKKIYNLTYTVLGRDYKEEQIFKTKRALTSKLRK